MCYRQPVTFFLLYHTPFIDSLWRKGRPNKTGSNVFQRTVGELVMEVVSGWLETGGCL